MALTQITNGMSGLNARNALNAAISSIDGLITQRIAYVEETGNDVTGQIGNPAKPFASIAAAIDAATNEDSLSNFGIQLGFGWFTYDRRLNEFSFPLRCKTIKGKGRNLTSLILGMGGAEGDPGDGQNGAYVVGLELIDLHAEIIISGGDALNAESGNGGNAGDIEIMGNASLLITGYAGTDQSGFSGYGPGIVLNGPMVCSLQVSGRASSATVEADGVDFSPMIFSDPCFNFVKMARCSYKAGTQLDIDLGGNAEYP